ncbi:MAG: hypothetical protein IJB32_02670, partial [Clostridia bacterium]|nr:hypothetical protein [Clostridia bacterium]
MQNFNYGSLFLIGGLEIGLIIAIVVFAVAGVLIGLKVGGKRKIQSYEKELGTVEERKRKLIDEEEEQSRAIKKEAFLEAKEQELKLR